MEILYKDNQIVVAIKPSGILSEGDACDCMPKLLRDELVAQGERKTDIFTVHRLDRETVGVMVYARTSPAAAELSRQILSGELEKEYLAVLHGTPEEPSGTLRDLIYYDRKKGKSFAVARERKGVKEAILDYELYESNGGLSLVSVKLRTGRTHQIRVQFASRALPLVGDRRYGAPKSEYKGLTLCAHRLSFYSPTDKEHLTFECPAPWGTSLKNVRI